MGKSKKIFSGLVWTVIQNTVNILYGLISVPFLISYFGKEEYGLIGIALSVNTYVQLLDMGMNNANVKFFAEYLSKGEHDKYQKYFSLTHLLYLVIGLLNAIILIVVSFYTDFLFKVTPEQAITLRNLLWILAINATFSWLSVCFDQLLRANEFIDWIIKRSTFLKLLQFVVLAVVLFGHLSIEAYFVGHVFIVTAILPLTILKAKKTQPWLKLNFSFDKTTFKTVMPYVLAIFSFGVFQFLASSSRPVFLGFFSGPSSVAEYQVMLTITSVITIFTGAFTQVLLPFVTKLAVSNDRNNLERVIFQGSKYVNILLTLLVFSIIASCTPLLHMYVGDNFIGISKWLMIWLLMLLLSHRNVMTSIVFSQKNLKVVAFMGFSAASIAIIVYCIFIPLYGVGGVVIGYFIHEFIHTLFYYFYYFPRVLHFRTSAFFIKSIIPIWFIALALVFVIYFVTSNLMLNDISYILLNASLYMLVFSLYIWFIYLKQDDKKYLLSLIRK